MTDRNYRDILINLDLPGHFIKQKKKLKEYELKTQASDYYPVSDINSNKSPDKEKQTKLNGQHSVCVSRFNTDTREK